MVVLLRNANAGPGTRFSTRALAEDLAALDVVNVGAAGTFVVRKRASQAVLRAEFRERLPFQTEILFCRGRDLLELFASKPFPPGFPGKAVKRFAAVFAKAPRELPPVPLDRPDGGPWQVRLLGVRGKLAWGLRRPVERKTLYPTDVLERTLGIPATTRTWDTLTRVCKVLGAA